MKTLAAGSTLLMLVTACAPGTVSRSDPFADPMGDQNEGGVAFACPDVSIGDAALCVCGDLGKTGGNLDVDGHVGVNGLTDLSGSNSHTEGSFVAQGGMTISGSIARVEQDLLVGGDLTGIGAILDVGGELRAAGTVVGFDGLGADTYAGGEPPCACGPDEVIDVAGLVAAKAAGDETRTLTTLGSNEAVTLTAGEYYFDALSAVGSNVHLAIEGAVSLYVEGSLTAIGSNEAITLAPGASLDLYVSDVVHAVGSNVHIGGGSPGAFRLYMGGAGDAPLAIGSNGRFDGVVYAPNAELAVAGSNVDVRGALFAGRFDSGGSNVHIGYADPSPSGCEPPPDGDACQEPDGCGDGDGDGGGSDGVE